MCQSTKAVGGPSTAELLRAIEWSGSPEQPMLCFQLKDGQLIESRAYRVFMVNADLFVISLRSTNDDALEMIWSPAQQYGRCIQTVTSV